MIAALALGLALLGAPLGDVPMKCPSLPGLDLGGPVVLLGDSVVTPEAGTDWMRDLAVESIEVTCWDPETGRFSRDLHAGVPVVQVTEKSEMDRLAAALGRAFAALVHVDGDAPARRSGEISSEDADITLRVVGTGEDWTLEVLSMTRRCEYGPESVDVTADLSTWREHCVPHFERQARAMRRWYQAYQARRIR